MEREADWQNNVEQGQRSGRAAYVQQGINVVDKEVVVLKDGQYPDVGHQAHGQVKPALRALGILNHDARDVVDYNRQE